MSSGCQKGVWGPDRGCKMKRREKLGKAGPLVFVWWLNVKAMNCILQTSDFFAFFSLCWSFVKGQPSL